MPSTQAYSVSWTVTIEPEGDVSDDVAEIVIQREQDLNTATVTLDTSKNAHALEEQKDISITLTDGTETISFDGYTDAVEDDEEKPVVTIDARTPGGLLDDGTAAGRIDRENVFRVIDGIMNDSPGEVREIKFDPSALESRYGTFASETNYGSISLAHYPNFAVDSDSFRDGETANEGSEAELRIDQYQNDTDSVYQLEITGDDSNGDEVVATLDLPPKDDSESIDDVFGSETVKLALDGGTERWVDVTGITTDIPTLQTTNDPEYGVGMSADVWNYVKTDWAFTLSRQTSVREAINQVVRYISALDDQRDWAFYVDQDDTLQVQPEGSGSTTTHVFREGDNVLKPVATRNLDGVRNFIKVVGAGGVNAWHWAYEGDLQYYTADDPFEDGTYPDGGVVYGGGVARQNHIDRINLRAESISSRTFTSSRQAIAIGKKALREFLRTPVSEQAPLPGLRDVAVGDLAEVYYPSRGIPAKVTDNTYTVEKVEYRVTPEKATTTVDFGIRRPNLADVISNPDGIHRSDLSDQVQTYSDSTTQGIDAGRGEFPKVGRVTGDNGDGTYTVEARDGETYGDVEVV